MNRILHRKQILKIIQLTNWNSKIINQVFWTKRQIMIKKLIIKLIIRNYLIQ